MKRRKVLGYAIGLSACPISGCDREPLGMFCEKHMAQVSVGLRMRIGRAMMALRGKGMGEVPANVMKLLREAATEVARRKGVQ